jgi:hypothetical protein
MDVLMDYANAVSTDRGCFPLTYEADGRPTECPQAPTTSGWPPLWNSRWLPVDAGFPGHWGTAKIRLWTPTNNT